MTGLAISNNITDSRNLALDFVKGILVVFMVIYHVMNIFSSAGPEAFGYIRFVSGSFLFISGYVIALFYEPKFTANKVAVAKRLALRGFKLLLLFTALNMAINLTGVGNPNKSQLGVVHYFDNFSQIYGLGKPGAASFQILLPIAYLLVLSPLFLLLSRIKAILTVACLIAAFCLSYFEVDSVNVGLGIIGVIGLYAGLLTSQYQALYALKRKPIIVAGLALSFFMMGYLDRNLLTYTLGVMVVIKLFYDLGMGLDLSATLNRMAIMFGQYSLLCYIAQIVLLQCLSLLLSRPKWPLGFEVVLLSLITCAILLALCFVIANLRARHRLVDKSYKFIFA